VEAEVDVESGPEPTCRAFSGSAGMDAGMEFREVREGISVESDVDLDDDGEGDEDPESDPEPTSRAVSGSAGMDSRIWWSEVQEGILVIFCWEVYVLCFRRERGALFLSLALWCVGKKTG
jgi:hypothetical protein